MQEPAACKKFKEFKEFHRLSVNFPKKLDEVWFENFDGKDSIAPTLIIVSYVD